MIFTGWWTHLFRFYQTVYVDACRYYFCFSADSYHSIDLAFKFSVLNRYLCVLLKSNGVSLFSSEKQYLSSLNSFIYCILAALFFPFKRRIRLHGLAFNVEFDASLRHLLVNTGLTQAPILQVPKFIESVYLNKSKRKVAFESRLRTLASSFIATIRDIRPLGVYHNPAKRGSRRGIRIYLSRIRSKKFNKDVK